MTYSDDSQILPLKDYENVTLIDIRTRKGKKEAWALKGHWGAKLDPFAIVTKGDKPIKAFYSEADNVVEELIKYLNNGSEN